MKIRRVNHLGIIVEDLDEAVRSFTERLGCVLRQKGVRLVEPLGLPRQVRPPAREHDDCVSRLRRVEARPLQVAQGDGLPRFR